ncbi:MAG TPA: NAD(P)(+) transhydrogenase (Re/Si-specific) subunit alpha, partial [Nitrospiria bacterium]|nr:NAD(P)(+) transhydrogenase (Re/Si-specific) subunit alpha [Nitrospiria bacterium]
MRRVDFMIIGIPKETFPGDHRVALIPATVPVLTKAKLEVLVEAGAGQAAGYTDKAYQEKGARMAAGRDELFKSADVILQVRSLGSNPEAGRADLDLVRRDQVVIGFMDPLGSPQASRELAERGVTAFSME